MLARTETVKGLTAGVSGMKSTLVHDVLFTSGGFNFASPGLQLDLHGGTPLRVLLTLGGMVADEAALHGVFCCKGASGLKPCFLCQNVFNAQIGE